MLQMRAVWERGCFRRSFGESRHIADPDGELLVSHTLSLNNRRQVTISALHILLKFFFVQVTPVSGACL